MILFDRCSVGLDDEVKVDLDKDGRLDTKAGGAMMRAVDGKETVETLWGLSAMKGLDVVMSMMERGE